MSQVAIVAQWWQFRQDVIKRLDSMLRIKPHRMQTEQLTAALRDLQQIQQWVQQTAGNNPLDKHLMKGLVNLRMSYEEQAAHHPERSERCYNVALNEFGALTSKLERAEVVGV